MNGIEVLNILPHVDVAMLCDAFRKYGKIASATVSLDSDVSPLAVGYIYYKDYASVEKAVLDSRKRALDMDVFITKIEPITEQEEYTNLYVKNFSLDWDDVDLLQVFQRFGEIQHFAVEQDKYGNSRGFGYVNFVHHSSAKEAIEKLNGKVQSGKKLYVQPHQNRNERRQMKTNPINLAKEAVEKSTQLNNLHVNNLPKSVTEEELKNLFSGFGEIRSVKIAMDDESKSKGYGFVSFSTIEAASKALQSMNGYQLRSQALEINFKQGKAERKNYLKVRKEIHSSGNYKRNSMYYSLGSFGKR